MQLEKSGLERVQGYILAGIYQVPEVVLQSWILTVTRQACSQVYYPDKEQCSRRIGVMTGEKVTSFHTRYIGTISTMLGMLFFPFNDKVLARVRPLLFIPTTLESTRLRRKSPWAATVL